MAEEPKKYWGLPPGPNVGTQLKALRRRKKAQSGKGDFTENQGTSHSIPSGDANSTDLSNVSGLKNTPSMPVARVAHLSELNRSVVQAWFESKSWQAFEFQQKVWDYCASGSNGMLHATTGSGKTMAVWLGALLSLASQPLGRAKVTRVLWITPMRALAEDSRKALANSAAELVGGIDVGLHTGDTDSATRTAQAKRPPFALVTTPESLTLMLTRAQGVEALRQLRFVVVDEWHELIGNKRGVQLQLALARLAQLNSQFQVWGLSATLGNVNRAMEVLLHPTGRKGQLVQGKLDKALTIDTLIPSQFERFPWGGHLGLKQAKAVAAEIDSSPSTLIFTNTRSQAEIWYQTLLDLRPEYAGVLAIHHGSLDKSVRLWVEEGLKQGLLKAVVCTSSLDLGVDFLPVERVIQIGSPKGVARLLQRAGRSGHAPGRPSRITIVPTHALEMMEAAAARAAVQAGRIEQRESPDCPLDVLVQHLVTVAMGTGFRADDLYEEVRQAWAYKGLSRSAFDWAVSFVVQGGESLKAYPDYQRVVCDDTGVYRVQRRDIARRHAMSVGTIVSDSAMKVAWMSGGGLGTIEESFVARLKAGDCFSFAGRVLELVKVKDMTAYVRKATKGKATVPQWQGGKMPLSSELAESSLRMLDIAHTALVERSTPSLPELHALMPLLELQHKLSALPQSATLLVETLRSKEGFHLFMYPFEGRTVHIGLASLFAWRASQAKPGTFSVSMNDYGFELLSAEPVDWERWLEPQGGEIPLFNTENLMADVLESLNASELAQRRFREIARISGLVFQGYPGAGKSTKQLQASSSLFFEVFKKHDQGNLLLGQSQKEALEQELEINRMEVALQRLQGKTIAKVDLRQPSPFAFPLLIERLRETVSTESLSDRVARMVAELEKQALS